MREETKTDALSVGSSRRGMRSMARIKPDSWSVSWEEEKVACAVLLPATAKSYLFPPAICESNTVQRPSARSGYFEAASPLRSESDSQSRSLQTSQPQTCFGLFSLGK